jgi:hypothetical protein
VAPSAVTVTVTRTARAPDALISNTAVFPPASDGQVGWGTGDSLGSGPRGTGRGKEGAPPAGVRHRALAPGWNWNRARGHGTGPTRTQARLSTPDPFGRWFLYLVPVVSHSALSAAGARQGFKVG